MKYLITIILISKVFLVNALSFGEIPLNKMIDEAEGIYMGKILEVRKTDSLLQNQLKNIIKSERYEIGDPNCGYCSETATFVISKSLKGQIQHDTVFIPFYSNFMFLLPGFSENQAYILFLDKLNDFDFFVKTDPRLGVKSSNLIEYQNLITEYIKLNSSSKKREWIIKLCINPKLSREGMLNFQYSNSRDFSQSEKKIMTEGLLKMDFENDNYLKLLECVQEFGKNNALILKCFDRLELIKTEKIYEGLGLMQAINEMDPKPEYKELIDNFFDGFNNSLLDFQKLELIKAFIKEKK